MMLLSFVSSYVGYSQLNAGLQAFARDVGRISTQGLGFAYACNTLVIVVLQLVVLRRIEGRRRTRVICVMSLIWSVSWVLLGLSGLVPGTLGATLLVAACASVFALGETLMQPTIPALVNDLAPNHLRGRYNAAQLGGLLAGRDRRAGDRRLADRPRRRWPLHRPAGRRLCRDHLGRHAARGEPASGRERRPGTGAGGGGRQRVTIQTITPMTTTPARACFQ